MKASDTRKAPFKGYIFLMTFEHVLGAVLAVNHLKHKQMDVRTDEIPMEDDAVVWVREKHYNDAKEEWEKFKKEVVAKMWR